MATKPKKKIVRKAPKKSGLSVEEVHEEQETAATAQPAADESDAPTVAPPQPEPSEVERAEDKRKRLPPIVEFLCLISEPFYDAKGKKRWGPWAEYASEKTLPKAQKSQRTVERRRAETWVHDQQENWRKENGSEQQSVQVVHHRVTAKWSDKDIEKAIDELTEHRERLKNSPAKKMPNFKLKDAPLPRFKIVRRETVMFEEEV